MNLPWLVGEGCGGCHCDLGKPGSADRKWTMYTWLTHNAIKNTF